MTTTLRPDDWLILETEPSITRERAEELKTALSKAFDHDKQRCVVITHARIKVIRPENA